MAIDVKLSNALVESPKRLGALEDRSVPEQIEYWSQIGKIAAENPHLALVDVLAAGKIARPEQ